MSAVKMHYAIDDAQVGLAKVAIFAFRCVACQEDYHIDHKPNFCPKCGIQITSEQYFGAAGHGDKERDQ